MRVCDEILRYLSKNKVKSLYGVPSGTISPIVDSLNDIDSLKDLLSEITEPIVINVITDSTEPIPTNRFRDLSGSVEHTICK